MHLCCAMYHIEARQLLNPPLRTVAITSTPAGSRSRDGLTASSARSQSDLQADRPLAASSAGELAICNSTECVRYYRVPSPSSGISYPNLSTLIESVRSRVQTSTAGSERSTVGCFDRRWTCNLQRQEIRWNSPIPDVSRSALCSLRTHRRRRCTVIGRICRCCTPVTPTTVRCICRRR